MNVVPGVPFFLRTFLTEMKHSSSFFYCTWPVFILILYRDLLIRGRLGDMSNYYPPVRRSRVEQHAKRRKTNFILNILIGIVFLAIVVVGYSILFGDSGSETKDTPQQEEKGLTEGSVDGEREDGVVAGEDGTDTAETGTQDKNETDIVDEEDDPSAGEGIDSDGEEQGDSTIEEEGDGEIIVEETSDDPNVMKTVIDPSWQPVGTSQTGDHVTVYDEGSTDRVEMEKALAYATNTTVDQLIVWWLQRGEVPNKNVIGTVEAKDQGQVYRVYLEWVDGQGWKPTKLEYLRENDKR